MDYGYKSLVSKRKTPLILILLLLCVSLFVMQAVCLQSAAAAAGVVESIEFNKGFAPLFGDANLLRSHDDKSVNLHLNQYTGINVFSIFFYFFIFILHIKKICGDCWWTSLFKLVEFLR